jgi:hypothetical protein
MQNSQPKEPLIQTAIPPGPWHTIGTYLFYLDGAEYLLVADYYSKYQFVREVPKRKSSSRTIANLTKEIFSEQGIPKIVRSDNGPPLKDKHIKSSQSNIISNISQAHHSTPEATGLLRAKSRLRERQWKKQEQPIQTHWWLCYPYGQLRSTALSHPQLSSYLVDQSKTTFQRKYRKVKQLRRWLADYYSGKLRRNTTITEIQNRSNH